MTVKKQQKEQEELRATTPTMIRALSILAAVAALAVTAAPVGSAHNQPFDDGAGNFSWRGAAKAPRPAGAGIIAILIGAKVAGQPSPRRLSTRSGGEVSSIDSHAKVPPPRSVTDGSSNTVMFGE